MLHIDWDAEDPYFQKPYRENYVLLYIPKMIKTANLEQGRKLVWQDLSRICGSHSYFKDQIASTLVVHFFEK